MKNIFPVIGLCMFLCGCGEDAPPTKSNSYTPPVFKKNEPAVAAPVQPATVQPATAQPAAKPTAAQTAQPAVAAATAPVKEAKGTPLQRPATQILNDAAAVVDYGTGATPLTAKKKMTDKIQSLQNQQNQNQQKVLNEK
ncbi:MAG: hypothetical protein WC637_04720 [Victivallales bacterium]|jgi:hypothetical protein